VGLQYELYGSCGRLTFAHVHIHFLHSCSITTDPLPTIHATAHLTSASHIIAKKCTLLQSLAPSSFVQLYKQLIKSIHTHSVSDEKRHVTLRFRPWDLQFLPATTVHCFVSTTTPARTSCKSVQHSVGSGIL